MEAWGISMEYTPRKFGHRQTKQQNKMQLQTGQNVTRLMAMKTQYGRLEDRLVGTYTNWWKRKLTGKAATI